ncbi:3-hydroxyacyl-CoA dehydrogenase NAD-binding domain-containing protein [Halopseudomonas salegens]|uniref:enoyl-CoA hydratase n=1 Tax=Halopseudomonas salegens TaxID=1434072 RepID=A0A1H2GIY3_9GAMM|nr:3-hydroxyacyl-CoA dehydrogenase NAD-binding domain-containing protein [Halopseudomonas salegens]SDU19623.1 short chain enoyl-CoA hydratase /3-hydroxyacyl-CoA dehydrogenase [Halopseudomonas salegens]
MTGNVYSALAQRDREFGPFERAPQQTDGERRNWHLKRDEQNVAWLLMDKADTSTNVLSEDLLRELDGVLAQLESDLPTALVIRSAKENGFCMGADISQFRDLDNQAQAIEKLNEAHKVVQRLADLKCPTIAVIHGAALGGGLELALCCDYRLAVHGATFATPEIQLGLHPGLGATVRLPALIAPVEAMTMMLTGKNVHDGKAKSLGLIDQLVEERHVAAAVAAVVNGDVDKSAQSIWTSKPFEHSLPRQMAARKMRAQAASKAPPEHYPAPEALIALWEEHADDPQKMLRKEVESFATLLQTSTSQNLVRVFFLREQLKAQSKVAEDVDDLPELRHIHVIGAGAMGGDIAGWCALQGFRVSLFDMKPEMIAKAVGKVAGLCNSKHLSPAETRDVLDRLIPDLANDGLSRADLVLEAVPEDLELKHTVYAEAEPRLKPGAILATNTSSIPLEKLREKLQSPERLVGIHFFNPAAQMQLVEVVAHDQASASTLAQARRFVGQIERLAAPVASAPGFLVNRALTPYLVETICLLDEGVAAEAIDKVALDFGMPMGPVELADQVGLDICLSVADMLRERLDTEQPATPDWLRNKVDDGELGSKSGKGLYTWKDGKPQKRDKVEPAPEDTLDRLILPMLNACQACLREQVIEDSDLLDGAMIFATGFAPFRGGPMHYARERGYEEIATRLNGLKDRHGDRFTPDSGWNAEEKPHQQP